MAGAVGAPAISVAEKEQDMTGRHTMRFVISATLAFCTIFLISRVPTALSAQPQPVLVSIKAGLDGRCKEGKWFPVRVSIENNSNDLDARLEISLKDFSGQETVYGYAFTSPAVSRKEIRMSAYSEGYTSEVTVILFAGSRVLYQEKPRLSCSSANDRIFGVLSENPSTLNFLSDLDPQTGNAIVAQLEIADIPDGAQALEVLDYLVIANIDSGQLSTAQKKAILGWVVRGGQLVVGSGSAWQKTSAGLIDVLPVTPQGIQTVQDLASLREFARWPDGLEEEAIVAMGSPGEGATVLVRQDQVPLLVTARYGSGNVYYLTVDPTQDPLRNWDGLVEVFRNMFSNQSNKPAWSGGLQEWSLASQAASTFPNLELPHPLLICGFLSLYVIAIGPASYILLRRFKRRQLAWLIIPAIVFVFSALAFTIGGISRGSRPVINRLAIIQIWPGIEIARLDGLVGIYSPQRDSFQVRINDSFRAHPMPSQIVPRSKDWSFMQIGDSVQIPRLPLEVSGIETFAVEGMIPAPPFSHNLVINTGAGGANLTGNVTNNSDLVLKDTILLFPGGKKILGEFRPGETHQIQVALTEAQQTRATSNNSPVFQPQFTYASPGGPYYGVPYDSTIEDILGTTVFFDDKSTFRRYQLLASALNYQGGGGSRGGGVFLSGWVEGSPLTVELAGRRFDPLDTSLYLVDLSPSLVIESGPVQLPPALFTWSILESYSGSQLSPYGAFLYSGNSYSLQFALSQPIPFKSVQSLTLHLNSRTNNNPPEVGVSLWDYEDQNWSELEDFSWGDIQIQDHQRYVGAGGVIQLKIALSRSINTVEIVRSDFTLVVNP